PPLAKAAQTEHSTRYIRHGLDINDFRVPMTNYAPFGQFIDLGAAGGEWPTGSNEMYIYGAGIWVGGTINDPSLQTLAFSNVGTRRDTVLYGTITDPRVVIGYNPSGGAEEFSGLTDIFITGHPEDYDTPDYWPLPDIVGIQDSYCEFDDQDIERWDTGINSNAGDGKDIAKYGLGVKVIQRTHSWNYENNKTIHFFIYQIVNVREDKVPIRNCFLSIMCDPDVGPTANDDLVGFDATRNLGYCYDSDFAEQGFARIPGFLAYKFLESPVAGYDVDLNGDDKIDTVSVEWNDVWVRDVKKGEPLGLASFKTSNLQSGDPDTELEKYIIMAGHNYPDVGDQRYAPFDLGTGTTPVDQRFFQNTGPFLLAPVGETVIDTVWAWDSVNEELKVASVNTIVGDTVRVVVAVLMAPDEEQLPQIADIAQSIYDIGFILPRPPDHPNFTLTPDDKKVYITWDDAAELSEDPYYDFTSDPGDALYDPMYRQVDFEGYKVYRSTSGLPGTFELLASWDKTSVTPRHVDVVQLSGAAFEGTVSYDETNTEGYILPNGGTALFAGHEYLIQVKSDTSFSVTDLTLGVPIPASEEEDHWYNTGEPPYVFELFDDEYYSLSLPDNIADGTYDNYFDGVNLLIGGMAINFTGDDPSYVPTQDVIFKITGYLEEAEGVNQEVAHAYIDTGLINGMIYYYDVIAYDFQPFSSPRSLENGIRGIAVTPRSHATGLVQGSAYDVQHSSGSSNGSVEVTVVEPGNVTGHNYEVGFYEGDPPLLWYLKDLNTQAFVLDSMSNQSGNDDYPVVDGLVVKAIGPSPGISEWVYDPSANRFFTGVNWGGGYFWGGLDLGVNFFGSSLAAADYVTIEVRFSDTERQKAYDYLRGGDPSYGYIGHFEVPFTAWDVTSDPSRQINIAFVEANGQPEYDSTWGPSLSSGGREYLFILASDYTDTPEEYYTTRQILQDAGEFDALYAGWFVAKEDAEGNPRTWTDGDVFRITPYFVNLVTDKFTFSTVSKKVDESLVNLDDIKVVPNPYIVRNAWERSRDYSVVAFTHLPDKCTIRIYTLSGDHLQTLEHESAIFDGNENWDLLTKNSQKIAAGIYIYHVDSDYGEKIGKFAVVR
ncbi:MAG: hypothetical protein KAW02_05585, partial [candidate division Zixibacteria bacterium]|nr:hypothetical protein [candidate division Zixibacteria bacterium]